MRAKKKDLMKTVASSSLLAPALIVILTIFSGQLSGRASLQSEEKVGQIGAKDFTPPEAWSFQYFENETSPSIDRGVAHQKPNRHFKPSLKAIKTAYRAPTSVTVSNKNTVPRSPTTETTQTPYPDTQTPLFHFEDASSSTLPYLLENRNTSNALLPRMSNHPKKHRFLGKNSFSETYFNSFSWGNPPPTPLQSIKTQPLPSQEKRSAPSFNEIGISLEIPKTDASSIAFKRKTSSPLELSYQPYQQEKKRLPRSPLDAKTFQASSYLYTKTYKPLASSTSPSPKIENAPPLHSINAPVKPPKIQLDHEIIPFTLDSQLDLYSIAPTRKHLSIPKKGLETRPSDRSIKGPYINSRNSTETALAHNHYPPSMQKTEEPFSKPLPKVSLPASKSASLFFATQQSPPIEIENLQIEHDKFAYRANDGMHPNDLSLPYVATKNHESPHQTADDIPYIESTTALNKTAAVLTSTDRPNLDLIDTDSSTKQTYLEHVKNKGAPTESSLLQRSETIPEKHLIPLKKTFHRFPKVDKAIHCASDYRYTEEPPKNRPIPQKAPSDLPEFQGKMIALQTDKIASQSKEILEDYYEENRFSAGLIPIGSFQVEGAPSKSEIQALNQSRRLTNNFIKEIPPPSDLETISYHNEFNTTVHYSKQEDGNGYLFSIKMKPKETLHFGSPEQHYVFIIDGSSSIKKHRFRVFKEGVTRALSYLKEGDSFNIIVADAELTPLSKEPISWSKASVSKAKQFLIDRSYRGFFINYDPFNLLSNVSHYFSPDKENIAVLITDGHRFKSIQHHKSDFEKLAKASKGKFSLFTATASQGNHLSMLDLMSTFNQGELMHSKTNASFPRKLAILVKHTESFIAKDIHVNVTHPKKAAEIEFYPNENALPSLYTDRPYTIYGSIDELRDFDLILQGRCNDQWINIKQTISFKEAQKTPRLNREIALQKAYVCYDYFLKNEDPFFLSEAQKILNSHHIPSAIR